MAPAWFEEESGILPTSRGSGERSNAGKPPGFAGLSPISKTATGIRPTSSGVTQPGAATSGGLEGLSPIFAKPRRTTRGVKQTSVAPGGGRTKAEFSLRDFPTGVDPNPRATGGGEPSQPEPSSGSSSSMSQLIGGGEPSSAPSSSTLLRAAPGALTTSGGGGGFARRFSQGISSLSFHSLNSSFAAFVSPRLGTKPAPETKADTTFPLTSAPAPSLPTRLLSAFTPRRFRRPMRRNRRRRRRMQANAGVSCEGPVAGEARSTGSAGIFGRLLGLAVLIAVAAVAIDDYRVARDRHTLKVQTRKHDVALAYEKRCKVDSMTTLRRFSVYLNGVVTGGESSPIYDEECENLLILLRGSVEQVDLFSPSVYAKQLPPTAVWNALGAVSTAVACYNASRPTVLATAFLFSAVFFALGMVQNMVTELPVLRWFLGGAGPDL